MHQGVPSQNIWRSCGGQLGNRKQPKPYLKPLYGVGGWMAMTKHESILRRKLRNSSSKYQYQHYKTTSKSGSPAVCGENGNHFDLLIEESDDHENDSDGSDLTLELAQLHAYCCSPCILDDNDRLLSCQISRSPSRLLPSMPAALVYPRNLNTF